jgi:plastocyanin
LVLVALACAAIAAAGFAAAGSLDVTFTPNGPQPNPATVAWGDTVTFKNGDGVVYTVQLSPETGSVAETLTVPPGGSFSKVYAGKAGEHRYSLSATKKHFRGSVSVNLSGQVTLAASAKTVVYGRQVELRGHTTLAQTPVTIQHRSSAKGTSSRKSWSDVDTVTPAPDGSFTLSVTPAAGTLYRATTAARQLTSGEVDVAVQPALQQRIFPRTSVVGKTIAAVAHIAPANAAPTVFLTRYDREKQHWVTVAQAAPRHGVATLRWKVDVAGKLLLRVELQKRNVASGFLPIVAPSVPVTVTWPPTTLSVKTEAVEPGKKGKLPPTHFDNRRLTAHPGRITIVMVNLDSRRHNIAIRGPGVLVRGRVVGKGGVSRVTGQLRAGSYTFYSSVGSDAQNGLTGSLVVR